jgi:hypothetical protein
VPQVFRQLGMADLIFDTNATLAGGNLALASMKNSQPTQATVHNCSSLDQGWWCWNRLTSPINKTMFTPNPNVTLSPFPPDAYKNLPPNRTRTPFFRGYAATISGPALRSTVATKEMLLDGLNGPPGRNDEAGFRAAMRQVLQQSASLDDKKKVIAECEYLWMLWFCMPYCHTLLPGWQHGGAHWGCVSKQYSGKAC